MLLRSWRDIAARTPQLQGRRVYLRPPAHRDWRAWAELRGESRDFLTPWEPTWSYDALTRGAYRRRLRIYKIEMRLGTSYSFFVFRNDDHALIGGVTLSNLRRGVAQAAALGYWVGERHARQGYMTEALEAILRFAFDDLTLHRIEAACLPGNAASKALLLRSGFQEEGYGRGYLRIDGLWQDHLLFAILREDMKERPRTAT